MKKFWTLATTTIVAIAIPVTTVVSCGTSETKTKVAVTHPKKKITHPTGKIKDPHTKVSPERAQKMVLKLKGVTEQLKTILEPTNNNFYTLEGSNLASYLILKPEIIKSIMSLSALANFSFSIKSPIALSQKPKSLPRAKSLSKPLQEYSANKLIKLLSETRVQKDDQIEIQLVSDVPLSVEQINQIGKIEIKVKKSVTTQEFIKGISPLVATQLDSAGVWGGKEIYWSQKLAQIFLDVKHIKANVKKETAKSSQTLKIGSVFKDLYSIYQDGNGAKFTNFLASLINSFKAPKDLVAFINNLAFSGKASSVGELFNKMSVDTFSQLKVSLIKVLKSMDLKSVFKYFSENGTVPATTILQVFWAIPPLLNIHVLAQITKIPKIFSEMDKIFPTSYRTKVMKVKTPDELKAIEFKNSAASAPKDETVAREKAVDTVFDQLFTILGVHNYRNENGTLNKWKYTSAEKSAIKNKTFYNHFRLFIKNDATSVKNFADGMKSILTIFQKNGLFSHLIHKNIKIGQKISFDLGTILDKNVLPLLIDLFNIDKTINKEYPGGTHKRNFKLYSEDDFSDSYKFSSKLIYNLFYGINLTLTIPPIPGTTTSTQTISTNVNIVELIKYIVSSDIKILPYLRSLAPLLIPNRLKILQAIFAKTEGTQQQQIKFSALLGGLLKNLNK